MAELRVLRVQRWTRNGKKCSLVLNFSNGVIDSRDAEKWARSVARDWGDINSQHKVRAKGLPGPAWWFSCVGHGGYIMVARKGSFPQFLEKFAADGYPCWGAESSYAEYAVLRFEEDCDWAVFEWLYPQVSEWSKKKLGISPTRDEIWGYIERSHSPQFQQILMGHVIGEPVKQEVNSNERV